MLGRNKMLHVGTDGIKVELWQLAGGSVVGIVCGRGAHRPAGAEWLGIIRADDQAMLPDRVHVGAGRTVLLTRTDGLPLPERVFGELEKEAALA